jgi:hypothetical protein
VCGTADAACGGPSHSTPVDELWQEVAVVGGELKTYEVEVNGNKTTMQLNERDARRMGLLGDADGGDTAQEESLVTSTKARTTSNKARSGTENK